MAPGTDMTLSTTLALPGVAGRMPVLGLGVWDSAPNVCKNTCLTALRNGYRHIDTAQIYGNEAEVGQAVAEAGVARADLFITTKIMSQAGTAEATHAKCARSIELLSPGPDGYVDLFLVHHPGDGPKAVRAMWLALERLHREGKARAIGVSNFNPTHIAQLKEYATVWPPAANQIELHPWLQQRETVKFCRDNGIVVEAYSPLTRMQKAKDPSLVRIAEKLGKSVTQVLVRYCVEKGWVPLPKSDKEHRLVENADVFTWQIGEEGMQELDRRQDEDGKLVVCQEA